MMTKFKSVSAQTPKLVGKNLAKVKGGVDTGAIHCNQQFTRNLTGSHHGCLTEVSARNLTTPFHGCLTEEAQ
jgi:hypothetical protein